MKSPRIGVRLDPDVSQEGRGTLGCAFSLALLLVSAFVAMKAGPPYFSYKSLEADLRTEVSRAGAHSYDDERIINDVLDIAKRNDVSLTRENVRIDRFTNQVQVAIEYCVPVDLIVYQYEYNFEVKAQTFVGRL